MRALILYIAFLNCGLSCAQQLKGRVLDLRDQQPVSGASVYIDGTSQGAITDLEGYFTINYPQAVKAALVIRMMGYETRKISKPLEVDLSAIKIVQKENQLEAVIINPDPWTRERKENYFKRGFLGGTEAAKESRILNLDSVRLRFNPSTGILSARSSVPILVENRELGYLVEVDVEKFDLYFKKMDTTFIKNMRSNNPQVYSLAPYLISTASTSVFSELDSKTPSYRKRVKNRKKIYPSTLLHFYKSLIKNDFEAAGFQLYYKDEKVQAKEHIRIRKIAGFNRVGFRNEMYTIQDSNNNFTIIVPSSQTILVDDNGYLIDDDGVVTKKRPFGMRGHYARLGISGSLPLDYNPE